MRKSKAEKLLNLLNNRELSKFYLILKREKKDRLLTLSKWLKKNSQFDGQADLRQKLFPVLFGQPYQTGKDYLLRKEFQLLAKAIESYLVGLHIEELILQNKHFYKYHLLETFKKRNAIDLFDAEYPDAYNEALLQADQHLAFTLSGLNFTKYASILHENESNLQAAWDLNELQMNHLENFYLASYYRYQANKVYLLHQQFPFSVLDALPKSAKKGMEDYEKEHTEYLFRKLRLYHLPPEERIEGLKFCLNFAKKWQKFTPALKMEIRLSLAESAMLYNMLEDFEQAEIHYDEFFKIDDTAGDVPWVSVLTDKISMLLKQQRISEALQLIKENEEGINKIEKYRVRLKCLKVAAFAFAGDSEALFKELPENFSGQNDAVKYFFRFFYAIHAWQIDQPVEALRELDNMLNSIRKTKVPVFDIRPVAKFMRRYFKLKIAPAQAAAHRNLVKMRNEMATYSETALPIYRGFFPFLWLQRELAKLIPAENNSIEISNH